MAYIKSNMVIDLIEEKINKYMKNYVMKRTC